MFLHMYIHTFAPLYSAISKYIHLLALHTYIPLLMHTPHSVSSSCSPCQTVLIVSTDMRKYRFGVPFKVCTYLLSELDCIILQKLQVTCERVQGDEAIKVMKRDPTSATHVPQRVKEIIEECLSPHAWAKSQSETLAVEEVAYLKKELEKAHGLLVQLQRDRQELGSKYIAVSSKVCVCVCVCVRACVRACVRVCAYVHVCVHEYICTFQSIDVMFLNLSCNLQLVLLLFTGGLFRLRRCWNWSKTSTLCLST